MAMDIFSGWTKAIYGPRVERKRRSLERSRANLAVQQAQNRYQTFVEETQRSGALLGQSLAGRGLGRSTIAEQEKGRFQRISERRRGELEKQWHIASKYKRYLKKRHRLERLSYYAGMMDLAVETAFTVVGMAGGGGGPDLSAAAGPIAAASGVRIPGMIS